MFVPSTNYPCMCSKKETWLLYFLVAMTFSSFAQSKMYENLYFTNKKKKYEKPRSNWDMPNVYDGFYIFRNCVYDFIKKDKEQVKARVIDIRNDSIYYVPYFNKEVAAKYGAPFDTLRIHPSEIRMIRLINTGFFVS